MSNIQTGDIVEPISSKTLNLPHDSTWRVTARIGNECELSPYNDYAEADKHRAYGRRFSVYSLKTVDPLLMLVKKPKQAIDHDALVAQAAKALDNAKELQAIYHDTLVAQAVKALDNAKELQAQARRKAAEAREQAEKQAKEQAEAQRRVEVNRRIERDKALARATLDLLVELQNLNAGGPDRPANQAIAEHAAQLDPLARSYGYKIAQAGSIFVVTKA